MLTSIWSNLVGTNSDDEFEEINRTGPRTEEERQAASLLSQFPAYGTQASRKVAPTSNAGSAPSHLHSLNDGHGLSSPNGGGGNALLRSSPFVSSPENGGGGGTGGGLPLSPKGRKDGKVMHGSMNHRIYRDMECAEDLNYDEYVDFMKSNDGKGSADADYEAPLTGIKSKKSIMAEAEKEGLIQPLSSNATAANGYDDVWKEEEQKLWIVDSPPHPTGSSTRKKSKSHKSKSTRTKRNGHSQRHDYGVTRDLYISDKDDRNRNRDDAHSPIHDLKELNLEELRRQWIHGVQSASTPTGRSQKSIGSTLGQNAAPKSGGSSTGGSFRHGISKRFNFSFDEETVDESYSSSEEDEECTETPMNQGVSTSIQNHFDERQHWMPDELCKQCYACDAQFTVFRRRHHCRLCGQVFCSRCSYFFIHIIGNRIVSAAYLNKGSTRLLGLDGDGDNPAVLLSNTTNSAELMNGDDNDGLYPSGRPMRVCKLCFDQVTESGKSGVYFGNTIDSPVMMEDGEVKGEGMEGSYDDQHQSMYGRYSPIMIRRALKESSLKDSDVRNLSSNEEDGPNDLNGGDSVVGETNSNVEGSTKKDRGEKTSVTDDDANSEVPEKESATPSKTTEEVQLRKASTPSTTRRFGRLAESAAREAQIGDAGFNDDEAKLIGTGVKEINDNDISPEKSNKIKAFDNDPTSPHVLHEECNDGSKEGLIEDVAKENRRIGLLAAEHLYKMGTDLLHSDAPLLLAELKSNGKDTIEDWINTLMMLATRCCATVKPDLKAGDVMSIRPYCKVKVIPGGLLKDSAFMSGVMFHKNVSNKKMAKEILNPKIMLLSGGIEYTRTETGFSSLDTLFDQEDKYMEILITKIQQLKPDILMVGRSVSRKAQELLLKSQIVLIQHVKQTLIDRIARQTGATVLSSTDHVMHQFGTAILGRCRRFRLVSFRNNEIWTSNGNEASSNENSKRHEVKTCHGGHRLDTSQLLLDPNMANHRRQAVLAAHVLGEAVHNGSKAVNSGVAKRGVTDTYIMIEGCPSNLGCTVVLRGASESSLKQVKRVLQYLIGCSYNLKLETSYLQLRRVRLPPDYTLTPEPIMSSSLCIDYGPAPQGRKVRPWNSAATLQHSNQHNEITAFDHQSILISSLWMAGKTQCCPAEVKGICYYSQQDVSLEQFLSDSCFNMEMKCQNPNCKKSLIEHSLSFFHNDGMINIEVELMKERLPGPNEGNASKSSNSKSGGKDAIAMWTFCKETGKVTPLTYLSDDVKGYSFGKFLEVFFYNRTMLLNSPDQDTASPMQSSSIMYFGRGDLAARFVYASIKPYGVYLRRSLPFDESFHRDQCIHNLEQIRTASVDLFQRFHKHIDRISNETRQLFGSAANKPEHLQTVLSELNSIDSEVHRASQILEDKVATVTMRYQFATKVSKNEDRRASMDAFMYFPWHSRRYLFMLCSAWNERLSSIGQALTAMKKLASTNQFTSVGRSDMGIGQNVIGDGAGDEVDEVMMRLMQLKDEYTFDMNDMSIRQTKRKPKKAESKETKMDDEDEFSNTFVKKQEDFSAEVDADVLASRRRYAQKKDGGSKKKSKRHNTVYEDEDSYQRSRHRKSKSSRRRSNEQTNTQDNSSSRSQSPSLQTNKVVTGAGAVKSAITRFFGRNSRDDDPYVVDLGIFGEGRPKLEPGTGGIVIPVFDDLPSTIIAHSLTSTEYESRLKQYSDGTEVKDSSQKRVNTQESTSTSENKDNAIPSNESVSSTRRSKRRDERRNNYNHNNNYSQSRNSATPRTYAQTYSDYKKVIERRMLARQKTHIKHAFRDYDEKGQPTANFVCTSYWATQFEAVRQIFLHSSSDQTLSPSLSSEEIFEKWRKDVEKNYVKSLSSSSSYAARGGKSGASFSRTADERFIVKCISRTELQMFLEIAPAYFEYLSKAFFHGLPTMLCKIVGVYQIGVANKVSGKRTMDTCVCVMQNIFFGRNISTVFDLKGSLRGRFAKNLRKNDMDSESRKTTVRSKRTKKFRSGSDTETSVDDDNCSSSAASYASTEEEGDGYNSNDMEKNNDQSVANDKKSASTTMLDGDFLEWSNGRPLPLNDRAKAAFRMSILNDTLFLSIINVLDYSLLVGIDEEKNELVVSIIDFLRQYDILKQMERVGKSIPMVVGSEAPTIIQPPLYKARFINAMERYFMTIPNKYTQVDQNFMKK